MQIEKQGKGSCLCGAVTITSQAMVDHMDACHCATCRKWGGGPFLSVACRQVQIAGEENITIYNSSSWAERAFCQHCGTHLYYRLKQGDAYEVLAGVLENGDQLVFRSQIFIDEKPANYQFANATVNLTGAEVMAKYSPPE